jgi:UDP-glucose 4-epimerase
MQTALIGGGGFIGRHVAQVLAAANQPVVVLGRRPTAPEGLPASVEYKSFDYGDRAALAALLPQCQAVIDLAYATTPQTSFADPVADLVGNVLPGVGLLEAVRESGWQGRLVLVSSGGAVYGVAPPLPLREDSPTAPVSPYGITKLALERYADMYHRLHDLNTVVVRPANAYGLSQRAFTGQGFIATAMGCIAERRAVTVFGKNGMLRDYVHVHDVATGIVAALMRGNAGEIYNIGYRSHQHRSAGCDTSAGGARWL